MREVTCVSEATYGDSLTRGKQYEVIDINEAKSQIRLTGDNSRTRWFPFYCFDFDNQPVPILQSFSIDDLDSIDDSFNASTEVTVRLSTGESCWCIFSTPSVLAEAGNWIPNTQIRFHYGKHLIIVNEVTPESIEAILHYLDAQNKLVECTLPLLDDSNDD